MPAPAPEPIWMAVGASPGDPIVWVRDATGVHQCHAQYDRSRQITVNGMPCEHVGEYQGVWVYEQRSW